MTRKFMLAVCTVALLLGGLGTANAALLNVAPVSGLPGDIVPAPPDAGNNGLGSETHQLGFNEIQGYTLLAPLNVDGGTDIPIGTIVNSHMILLNHTTPDRQPELTAVNIWEFDGIVIGVMSDPTGIAESQSSSFLGADAIPTSYPGAPSTARGLENNDASDFYTGVGTNFLTVGMHVTQPGDWIRVVTAPAAVPVPSAMLLFSTGLIGLIAFRGMKKK